MTIKVPDIMTTKVIVASPDDTVGQTYALFKRHSFHHLPVVENKKVVGVISLRDILQIMSPFVDTYSERDRDKEILKRHIHQVMTHKPIVATTQTTLEEAAKIFVNNGISCLPVVDEQLQLLGILTSRDILKKVVLGK